MVHGTRRLGPEWWLLMEGAVGTVAVVVVDVVDDEPLELALVPDDGAVEQFSADGSDPAFGGGVCHEGTDWGLDAGDSAEQGSVIVVDRGRSIWFRRTVSWWRSTMISRSLARPDRVARRAIAARNRYWDAVHEASASAGILEGQTPRPSIRHAQPESPAGRPRRPCRPVVVTGHAAFAGLSRPAFSRRFSETAGESPTTYVKAWRLSFPPQDH